MDRPDAAALDAADPIAWLRAEFAIDDDGPLYLAGNSLGRLPRATADRLSRLVSEEWGRGLVGSWDSWVGLPGEVGDDLAPLIGARAGEVVVCDSTSVNLYKVASAALAITPGALVVDAGEFPTDRYLLEGLAHAHGRELRRFSGDPNEGPSPDVVAEGCAGGTALLCVALVHFKSGALADLVALTEVAHRAGALVLWDLSHAVGAVPIDLDGSAADLAVGCTYKYLNAGPGAPALAYVRRALQPVLRQPMWGWFGQRDQFAMGPRYDPVDGIGQLLVGTPDVPGLHAVQQGVSLLAKAGIDALRVKGMALTGLAVDLSDAVLAPLGFSLASPRDPERRGSHLGLRHPEAASISNALRDVGVVADFRSPDVLRIGLPPAYTRFVDVWDAIDAIARLAL